MTPLRDAAEHLFRDLTDTWVITTQNGIIDCIEEHIRAYSSSTLTDLALARRQIAQLTTDSADSRAREAKLREALVRIVALEDVDLASIAGDTPLGKALRREEAEAGAW